MLLLYEMERRSRECKRGDKKGKGEEGMENNRDGGDGDKLKCVRNLIRKGIKWRRIAARRGETVGICNKLMYRKNLKPLGGGAERVRSNGY